MSSTDTSKLAFAGRRQTFQRAAMLRVVEEADGPLSALQIFEQAQLEVPEIGLSTIYRTLKMLLAQEVVQSVLLPDGVSRYEKVGRGPHHFHCRSCSRIWTLENNAETMLRCSHLRGGFVVEDNEIIFRGQCPHCRSAVVTAREVHSRQR